MPTCPICQGVAALYCRKSGYLLYQCGTCKHTFVYPTPPNLAEIYTEQYFKNDGGVAHGYVDYDQDKEPMRSVFVAAIQKLESLTPLRTLFDVGAATGFFLDRAKECGWQTSGSEISDYAADIARSRGHHMYVGELPTMQIAERLGAISMWDVLEHVADPRAYVRAVHGLLADDGVLFVNTVNVASLWARLLGKRWQLIVPPEHLNYFSTKSIQQLLTQEGFEVLECRNLGKKFSLAYICKMLYAWQGLRIWRWLATWFDRPLFRHLEIPINLHDNLYCVARKKAAFLV